MYPQVPMRTKVTIAPYVILAVIALFVLDDWGAINLNLQPAAAHHRIHRRPVKGAAPSRTARGDIPRRYLRLYREAGARYRVPWSVLAGIGKVESDHGRSTLPGVHSGSNSAGACGPMQIGCVPGSAAGNSWARYGRGDVHRPEDAIPAAARYLVGHGAHRNIDQAIYGYNHAGWYVAKVKAWASRYARR